MKYENIPLLPEQEYRREYWKMGNKVERCLDFLVVEDELPIRYQFGLTDLVRESIEELKRT